MNRFIVTGGAGFIGSHIARKLVSMGQNVKIIDNFSSGGIKNITSIREDIEVIQGDIRDLELLKKAFKGADFVFHEAAIPSVQASIDSPIVSEENNVIGTINVLTASRECNIKRVVFASSAAVYGDSQELPKSEELLPNPLSPYAVQKLCGEYYMKIFNRLYGLETVCLRYFNVFGPGQNPNSPYSGVISILVDRIINGQIPVIFGDGSQTRDFVFVDNVVDANLTAVFSDKVGRGEVINIASGDAVSLNKLLSTVCSIAGKDIRPVYEAPRHGDIRHSSASIEKAQRLLDYKPAVDFEKGLCRLIEWADNGLCR